MVHFWSDDFVLTRKKPNPDTCPGWALPVFILSLALGFVDEGDSHSGNACLGQRGGWGRRQEVSLADQVRYQTAQTEISLGSCLARTPAMTENRKAHAGRKPFPGGLYVFVDFLGPNLENSSAIKSSPEHPQSKDHL